MTLTNKAAGLEIGAKAAEVPAIVDSTLLHQVVCVFSVLINNSVAGQDVQEEGGGALTLTHIYLDVLAIMSFRQTGMTRYDPNTTDRIKPTPDTHCLRIDLSSSCTYTMGCSSATAFSAIVRCRLTLDKTNPFHHFSSPTCDAGKEGCHDRHRLPPACRSRI